MGSSREGWTRVQFGDVVENVNDQPKRATLPLETRYIAGEHVDENRLTIDRWGTLGDDLVPPTFKRRFQPGDVLFHSRNLKKIAVPDFGGITGEKLFVLRSSSPSLLQEFVPYVLLSPTFARYAEASWSGSVNKFLNWTPLARYAFDLPPLDEQRRLVVPLEAMTRYESELTAVVSSAKCLVRAALTKAFHLNGYPRRDAIRAPAGWQLRRLEELTTPDRVVSYGILLPGKQTHDGVPMLRIMDFDEFGRRAATDVYRVAPSVADTSTTTYCQANDLLVSVMATVGRTFVVPSEMSGWNMNRALALVPCRDRATALLLHAYFQSGYVQRLLDIEKIGSAQPRINLADLKTLPIPLPPSPDDVLSISNDVFNTLSVAEHRLIAAGEVAKQFREEVFA
jgi:type I restriction enzyme S subunit